MSYHALHGARRTDPSRTRWQSLLMAYLLGASSASNIQQVRKSREATADVGEGRKQTSEAPPAARVNEDKGIYMA